MNELVFVKLGGSVITDKTQPEVGRPGVIRRLASEIASARAARPELSLVLGHGSGSFGHVVASRYGTRRGVHSAHDWRGFAEVAAVAARLNRIVTDTFLEAGVPVWSLQPSASARCRGGELVALETRPLERALSRGLVPLVFGDVALDEWQGGTIISTEQIFGYLVPRLCPQRVLLVSVVDGVFEGDPLTTISAKHVPEISPQNWERVRSQLGGSHAADVTGGMLTKVEAMVMLVREVPGLEVYIFSGQRVDALRVALQSPGDLTGGTRIHWHQKTQ
jgi:isopentenyl phosphate kinase